MTARHHHFLSQCYLKGFTELGTKKSKLICIDLQKRRQFPTIPRNAGGERDFNRLEIPGLSADALESKLGEFEDLVDRAIRHVENTGRFEGEERAIILNVIALFAVRSPYRRAAWNSTMNYIAKLIVSYAAAAPTGSKVNGIEITEKFKTSYKKSEQYFTYATPKNKHIDLEFHGVDAILPALFARNWFLLQAPDSLSFLTCDFPISLEWKDSNKYTISPGFACMDTRIYFALSKKFALIGEFEGKEGASTATEKALAAINTFILSSARSWVYTSQVNICFLESFDAVAYGIDRFFEIFDNEKVEQVL